MSVFPDSPVALLQRLIQVPSVNPDGEGDPGVPPEQRGELACAECVGALLEGLGAEVSYEDVMPRRPNVIARFPHPDRTGLPRILFAPHTDTVSVRGMRIDPFAADLRDGRIWGRGACDTKGSMAAMLWAFHELRDRFASLPVEVGFVGLMGEETGQPGSRHFAEHHGHEWDFALVGEPTELETVHLHKGCVWVRLETRGRAVHGAKPELGENALLAMLPVIEALRSEFGSELAQYAHPVLGPATQNFGMCHAGHKANIVPDRCTLTLDFRVTPELAAAGGVVEKLRAFLEAKGFGDSVGVELLLHSEPLDTDSEHPQVKRLGSLGSPLAGAPWFCDAGWLSLGGIPSVAIGPGSIDQAHTDDEWLEISALEEAAAFFRRFLESFAEF